MQTIVIDLVEVLLIVGMIWMTRFACRYIHLFLSREVQDGGRYVRLLDITSAVLFFVVTVVVNVCATLFGIGFRLHH